MIKEFTSLGLMSGTSGDGVDASLISSDGISDYKVIQEKYFEYDEKISNSIHTLKDKIYHSKDLIKLKKELSDLERNITLFHAKVIKHFQDNNFDLVGFHGQTIYHNAKEKITKQLGDGNLLSQLTKENIVYNFRQNDIYNGGEGAPLTPIFHQLISTKLNLELPLIILNIGGISNITLINGPIGSNKFISKDVGPGNCLIDTWVRNNSSKKFDEDGALALAGEKNDIIFEQAQELFSNRPYQNHTSFDVNDFDVSFARGLSLEDGAATLTDLTAKIISSALTTISTNYKNTNIKILVAGGGRKNNFLMNKIKQNVSKK